MYVQNSHPILQSSPGEGVVEIEDKMIFLDIAHKTKTLLARFHFHFQKHAFLEFFALGEFLKWHTNDPRLIKFTKGFLGLNRELPFGSGIEAENLLLNLAEDLAGTKSEY